MLITSSTNRTLKDIRRLRRSKGPQAVLEGPHLLEEALNGGLTPEICLMTPEFLEGPAGAELADRLPRPPLLLESRLLPGITDADTPQGAIAVVQLPRGDVQSLVPDPEGIYLYLDGIQDPGNLGALARVAEAAGCSGLVLAKGTVHPNHPRALRASAGSLLRLPVAMNGTATELQAHLQSVSPRWLALSPRDGRNVYQQDWKGARVLALGAEGKGLSQELLSQQESALPLTSLTIPLVAPVESLNVTVAAAVTLFEIRRWRDEKG